MTFFFESASYVFATCALTKLKNQRWPIHMMPATTWIHRKTRFNHSLTVGSMMTSHSLGPFRVRNQGVRPTRLVLVGHARESPRLLYGHSLVLLGAASGPPASLRQVGQGRERRQAHGMKRRARRHRLAGIAPFFGEARRAEREAPFALADARAEPGVALQRLDVAIPLGDGAIELVEGDVFATTGERFHGRLSPLRTRSAIRTFRTRSHAEAPRGAA